MNEIAQLAFADYERGMKYKEIAEKYNVCLSTVKSWASRYWKKEGCNQKAGKLQPESRKVATKRGGQKGNKNAVGHGGIGPPGNKNAVKTGEFETLFFDTLEEDEIRLLSTIQMDKEKLLLREIQLLTIRERRMMKRIELLKTVKDDPAMDSNNDKVLPGMSVTKHTTGIEKGKSTDLKEYEGILGQIQSVEDALTRVQARQQRAIESLHKFGYDDARLELESMKFELELLRQDGPGDEMGDDGFVDAMNDIAEEVWGR